MKLKLLIYSAGCLALASANAGSVLVRNYTEAEDAGYALFNEDGTLLSSQISGNIRLGILTDGFDVSGAWNSGNISAIADNFLQFGDSGSLFPDTAVNGLLQTLFTAAEESFANLPIVLWVSNSADFLNPLGQHLIFRFGTHFSPSTASTQIVSLMPDNGELLVGDFGQFSHDYGFGGGVLPGFNLESVVPEPSTYALIIGAAMVSVAVLRRRKPQTQA